jgi:Peptidase family M28
MPDLRLYRVALIVAFILAAASLLALRQPPAVELSAQPTVFDGQAAMATLQSIVQDYPGRTAGSAADREAAGWVADQLKAAGLEPHVEPFPATIDGTPVSLDNVWAATDGSAQGAIVVLAPRDSPPLATQGANDDASGTAALLQLAQVFAGAHHSHPVVFVSTDGDGFGSLGAKQFLEGHRDDPIIAVVALRQVAGAGARVLNLNGWSTTPRLAPPWLWALARSAVRQGSALRVPLPPFPSQVLRLAVPCGGGSQAPFIAAGLPAIGLTAAGPSRPVTADTLDSVSTETLTATGRSAELLITSLDGAPQPLPGSSATVFFSRYRQLAGGVLIWILLALCAPLVVVTVDLVARTRRRRLPLRHAALRLGLRAAPWLAALAIVYLANLAGLLPGTDGGVITPDASVSHAPRFLRVLLIVLVLAVAYHYAMTVERRLARRFPSDTQAVVAVTHVALVAMAALMVFINPFALALILPAALLWPLARPGSWVRSRLLVWLGLIAVVVAFVYFGQRLHLGWDVWWYFFLLIETRTIPMAAVVLAVVFVAATTLLGHELHSPLAAPGPAPDTARSQERGWSRRHDRAGRIPAGHAATGTDGGAGDLREAGGPPEGGPPARSVRRIGRRPDQ